MFKTTIFAKKRWLFLSDRCCRYASQVLGSVLRELYHLLKTVESTDLDEVTRLHAQAALGELDTVMKDYLFPRPSFTKRIQVLP